MNFEEPTTTIDKKEVSKLMLKVLSTPFPKNENLVYTKDSVDAEPPEVVKFISNLQFLLAFRKFGDDHSSVQIWTNKYSVKFRDSFNKLLETIPEYARGHYIKRWAPQNKI